MSQVSLPDRLVQAGVELLEQEGLANLTLRAIARRTGVSHGAPRRYWTGPAATSARRRSPCPRPSALELLGTTGLAPMIRYVVRAHTA